MSPFGRLLFVFSAFVTAEFLFTLISPSKSVAVVDHTPYYHNSPQYVAK